MTPEEDIRRCLSYDHETGAITRIAGRKVGRPAGWVCAGYLNIQVGDFKYKGHRVAWLLHYGEWPKNQIDHIDGDALNNRIVNLRDIPAYGNQQNVTKRGHNKSGYLGVSFHKAGNKWQAQITCRGKKRSLGLYESAEDAAASYELAKFALHKYQPTERGKRHVS